MPKVEEKREEDVLKIESWQERVFKNSQKPPKDALLANTILSASLATPIAELGVIGTAWMMMINHQLDKAEAFKKTLPLEQQKDYEEKIKAFKEGSDGKGGFRLLSDELIYNICMANLSILGQNRKDSQDMGVAIINSQGTLEERRE